MIRPIRDRVVLEKIDVLNPTAEGIITPDGIKERPVIKCRVVAVGPGKTVRGRFVESRVRPGDTCLLNQYDQTVIEIDDDGKRYLMVGEDDLLCLET